MAPKAWVIPQAFVFCVKVGRGVASADRSAYHNSFVMRAPFRTVQFVQQDLRTAMPLSPDDFTFLAAFARSRGRSDPLLLR